MPRSALLLLLTFPAFAAERVELKHAPAPVDNPLKGLVPYQPTCGPTSRTR